MLNLGKSDKILKILNAVFDEVEIQEDRKMIKIPLEIFKKSGFDYFDYNEITGVIKKLDGIIVQLNESVKADLSCYNSKQYISERCIKLTFQGLNTKEQYLAHNNLSEDDIKDYLILEVVNWKKFKNLKKIINNNIARLKKSESQNRSIIEVVSIGDKIKIQIEKCLPITFDGRLRCTLIKFFYANRHAGEWHDYADISKNTKYNNSSIIRHEIKRINNRIYKHTDKKVKEIIERKQDDSYGRTSPYLYRWK